MQMAKLAATPAKLQFARRAENTEWTRVQVLATLAMFSFL